MSEKIILKIDKPIQLFEINGVDYEVYYDDESLKRYEKILLKFGEEYEAVKRLDIANMSESERESSRDKQEKLITDLVESIFGKESYLKIYNSIGKSILNLLQVIEAFANWISNKLSKYKETKVNYYTKNKRLKKG